MATDNVVANNGAGGSTFRSLVDAGGIEWPASVISYAPTISAGANVLQPVNMANALPIQPGTGVTFACTQSGTWTVTQSGTWVFTETTLDATAVAPGSTTAPTKALVVMGKTADVTPAYDPIPLAAGGGSVVVSGTGSFTVTGTVTSNQGAAAALAGAWPVQVTDGTHTMPTGDASARTIHTTIDNASLAVTGTFWQATQPVSGTITANAGTGTFTVGGTVTANLGTLNGAALDATLTGGTAKAIARGGQKGTTNTNADITHTASGANHEALDVALYDGAGNQIGVSGNPVVVSGSGTFTVSGSVTQGTAAALSGAWPVKVTDGTNVQPTGDASARSIHTTVDNATLAVTQSGTWTVATNADAGVSAGAAPTKSLVIAGQYNTSAPTLTNTQTVALQTDVNGLLKVNVAAGGGSGGTSSSFGSAFPATGTAVGASDGTNMKALLVDASGFLKVNVAAGSGGNGAASNTGAAVPTQAGYTGVNVAGNLQGAVGYDLDTGAGTEYVIGVNLRGSNSGGSFELGTATHPVKTDPTGTTTQPVSGTVTANAGTGTFTVGGTVTANIGTTNGLALDATVGKLNIAQGAALGSNTGPMLQGSVTTAAPTYTTGNINPLSLTTGGLLRVDASGATVPVSGTFWQATQPVSIAATVATNITQIGGSAISLGSKTSANSFPVVIASDQGAVNVAQSGTWTMQPGNTANTTPWLFSDQAATSGGTSLPYTFLSTAAVQAANIKNSAGQVYALHFFNINATPVYVRLYNLTSTPATTDTPVYRAVIPGNTAGAGFVVPIPPGVTFGTGIGIRVTGAIADNDATALSANTVIGNVFYK